MLFKIKFMKLIQFNQMYVLLNLILNMNFIELILVNFSI